MLPAHFTLLQVVPSLDAGGAETVTLETAAQVTRHGGRALVASRGGALENRLRRLGGELVRQPLDRRDPLSLALNAGRLERLIRGEGVSLVHVRSRGPAFSALWAARRAGVPTVASYHGAYSAGSALKRRYNAVMTRADAVIVGSAFARDHVLAQHPQAADRLEVIPEGVDTEIFDPAAVSAERVAAERARWRLPAGDDRGVILLAARFTALKGHAALIEAVAENGLRDRARLVFVGPGEKGAYALGLAERAARAGVALTLSGPSDDMPAAYLAADLVATPSIVPETFGRAVAEAGAMGRVVIASRLGGPAEIVAERETGFLAPAGDARAWAAALTDALALAPDRRGEIGQAARARIAAQFSAARMGEATLALYRRLLDRCA